jgi:hypothetical protein
MAFEQEPDQDFQVTIELMDIVELSVLVTLISSISTYVVRQCVLISRTCKRTHKDNIFYVRTNFMPLDNGCTIN